MSTRTSRSISIDDVLWGQTHEVAKTLGVSAAELVRLALVVYLRDHGVEAESALAAQATRRIGTRPLDRTGTDLS